MDDPYGWAVALVLVGGVAAFAVLQIRAAARHRNLPLHREVERGLRAFAAPLGLAYQGRAAVAVESPHELIGRVVGRYRGYDAQVVVLGGLNAFATHPEDFTELLTMIDLVGSTGVRTAGGGGYHARFDASVQRARRDHNRVTLVVQGSRRVPLPDASRLGDLLEQARDALEAAGVGPSTAPPLAPPFLPVPLLPPR